MDNYQSEVDNFTNNISAFRATYKANQSSISKLKSTLAQSENQTEIDNISAKLKTSGLHKDTLSKSYKDESSKLEYLKYLDNLLKDSGIKASIVESYVPTINKIINDILQDMDFNISFYMDSEFKETIKSRHREIFSYFSFSEGEKQRISTAILFMFREISRRKNSTACNLLILDEYGDSSLDHEGVDSLLKLINSQSGIHTFLISHNDKLLDKLDGHIVATKQGFFSHLKIDK